MFKNFKFDFDISVKIRGLTSSNILSLFRDGRAISPVVEMIVPNIFNVQRSNSKGYDFKYKDKRIELKTITKNGTKSCPSYMSGKDRSYDKSEHEEHIKNNHAYIFVDISNFPKTTWYVVNSSDALLFKSKRYLASKTMFESICKPFKFKIDKKINLT